MQNSFKRRCNSLTALTKYGYELSILEKIPLLATSKTKKTYYSSILTLIWPKLDFCNSRNVWKKVAFFQTKTKQRPKMCDWEFESGFVVVFAIFFAPITINKSRLLIYFFRLALNEAGHFKADFWNVEMIPLDHIIQCITN